MQYENGTKDQICRGATARGKLMPPVLPIFEVARALEVEHEEDDEEASEVEHEDEEASGARAVVEEEEDSGAVSPSRGGGWPAAASIAAIKSRASTKSSLGIAVGCSTGGCGVAAPRLVGSDIIMPPPCIAQSCTVVASRGAVARWNPAAACSSRASPARVRHILPVRVHVGKRCGPPLIHARSGQCIPMLYGRSCDYGLRVCATANVPGAFPAVCNVWTIDFAALVLAGAVGKPTPSSSPPPHTTTSSKAVDGHSSVKSVAFESLSVVVQRAKPSDLRVFFFESLSQRP